MSVWEWELTFRQEKKRITCTLLLRTIEHVVFLLTEQPFIIRLTMQIFLKSINIALDLLHYKKGLDNEA